MASIFRRIYDWLLRLFWCVFPLVPCHQCCLLRLDAPLALDPASFAFGAKAKCP
jgi:hypothetical protein